MIDEIKPKRTILYCIECKWAADVTDAEIIPTRCPVCGKRGYSGLRESLHSVVYHEHEKVQANGVLQHDIGKAVNDVLPYEETPK